MTTINNYFLSNFMQRLKDGARPNQFAVDITIPTALRGVLTQGAAMEDKFRFMCKAASIPESTIGETSVSFRGAKYKIPGDREFSDWEVTCYNDVDFIVRNTMEQWSDAISGNVNRDRVASIPSALELMGNATVYQLDRNNQVLKPYNVVGIWPGTVGNIALDFESDNQIEVFPVNFKLQWWESYNSTRNNTTGDVFADNPGAENLR